VNLVDTADVYSGGFAEEITGEVITGRRDSLLLSTKVRMTMGPGPNDAGLSRQHIIAGCESSLRRLGTDHIDIYHVHEWDGQTRLEETVSALNSLVEAGKVRYLAASNYAGWQLMKALSVADAHSYERFAAQQVYYSLEARDAEYELVPLAVDQGLGILVWSPLAGGLLSGKYRRDASPADGTRQLSGTWNEPPVRNQEKLYDTVEVLVDVAAAHGASPAQVALAWLLGRPAVTSVIIGARTDEQLSDNLGAAGLTLTADERDALDKVSAPELVYPYWHQLATANDRLGPADLALLGQHLRSE
jgi:aryl-alcohol dehydrogenase-like predicted oxidoreductase